MKRLLVVIVSSLLTLALMEVAFRALSVKRFERALDAYKHDTYASAPGTDHLYTMQPDVAREARVSKEPDAWTWNYTTDGAGRRVVPDRTADAGGGGQRVVALGDSYTFGWGVDDEHTYPAQLERRLRDEYGLEGVEVINAGTPGFNTMQEASYLASRWEELRPDVVVLGFVMNDAEPPRSAPRDPRERYCEASIWLWEELLLRTGWTDGALTSRAQRQRAYPLQFAPGAPERALCRRSLGEIAERCAEHAVPLLLFITPATNALPRTPADSYRYEGIHRVVQGWGEELGLATVDLLPLFVNDERRLDRESLLVPGDGHPSELALGIFAEAMAPSVAEALGE